MTRIFHLNTARPVAPTRSQPHRGATPSSRVSDTATKVSDLTGTKQQKSKYSIMTEFAEINQELELTTKPNVNIIDHVNISSSEDRVVIKFINDRNMLSEDNTDIIYPHFKLSNDVASIPEQEVQSILNNHTRATLSLKYNNNKYEVSIIDMWNKGDWMSNLNKHKGHEIKMSFVELFNLDGDKKINMMQETILKESQAQDIISKDIEATRVYISYVQSQQELTESYIQSNPDVIKELFMLRDKHAGQSSILNMLQMQPMKTNVIDMSYSIFSYCVSGNNQENMLARQFIESPSDNMFLIPFNNSLLCENPEYQGYSTIADSLQGALDIKDSKSFDEYMAKIHKDMSINKDSIILIPIKNSEAESQNGATESQNGEANKKTYTYIMFTHKGTAKHTISPYTFNNMNSFIKTYNNYCIVPNKLSINIKENINDRDKEIILTRVKARVAARYNAKLLEAKFMIKNLYFELEDAASTA